MNVFLPPSIRWGGVWKCYIGSTLRLTHLVRKDRPTINVGETSQLGTEPRAVENIVAQNQGNSFLPNEICTQHKGLREPLRSIL